MERGLFEIWRVGRENLPAFHLFPQHFDGSHAGKLAPKTVVVLHGRGQPHSVIFRLAGLVAQDEDDLVLDVDGEAAEHGPRAGKQRGDCVEHEFVRDGFAAFDGEGRTFEREKRIATGLFHERPKMVPSSDFFCAG